MENSIFQVVYKKIILLQNVNKGIDNMTNIKKLLGKKIKTYREKKGLTQEELAEKIGINSRSVSLIECGTNFITADTLTNIINALDVSPKALFDFDDDYVNKKEIKEKLLNLIENNEDKINTIYKIIKGYLE